MLKKRKKEAAAVAIKTYLLNCSCNISNNTSKDVTKQTGSRMVSQDSSFRSVRQWGIMGAILFILPKCPLCILALISMGSGVGLTAAQANSLEGYLLILLLTIFIVSAQKMYTAQTTLQISRTVQLPRFFTVLITALISIFIFASFFSEQLLHVDYYGGRIVYSCPIWQ